jgi:ATP-dependent exoDNAse (exonuclease V) beta subunit
MFNHVSHEFPKLLQENTDGTRYYVTPNGERYPSVTTILADYKKKEILEWRERVGEKTANRISKAATTRGTSVHSVIEKYLNNEEIDMMSLMPNVKGLFVHMRKELDKMNNIHCLESKLHSHILKLAGTVDCIAEYDGVMSVIDFKTSKRLKRKEDIANYFMQGTAYSVMFEELTNQAFPIEQIVILIGVDGKDFAQVLKVKPMEYAPMLKEYILRYRQTMELRNETNTA